MSEFKSLSLLEIVDFRFQIAEAFSARLERSPICNLKLSEI
jgi:hypothetical protein